MHKDNGSGELESLQNACFLRVLCTNACSGLKREYKYRYIYIFICLETWSACIPDSFTEKRSNRSGGSHFSSYSCSCSASSVVVEMRFFRGRDCFVQGFRRRRRFD